MDEARVERVLLAVTLVPPGRVASYGAIGRVAGVGPRQVGAILREHGDGVPWWRVTDRDGRLPAPLLTEALARWEAEGLPARPDGLGCRMAECAADPARLLDDFLAASP